MTNKDEDDKTAPAPPELTERSESGKAPEPEENQTGPTAEREEESLDTARPPGSGAMPVGLLALVVALLSAGGSGWLWWQAQGRDEMTTTIGELRAGLLAGEDAVEQLAGRIDRLAERNVAIESAVDGLREQLERQAVQLGELPLRIGRVERALDQLPGVADQARSAWILAEAEYFLRIANAQLTLGGNPEIALRAQELADEKLRDVGDPGLTRVRALLADEMAAVKAVPQPDTEGIVLALDSLSRNLDTLPLAERAPTGFSRARPSVEDESGLARAWNAIVEALMSVIRVKRTDETVTPLLSGEEESMLMRSLDVDLQIARLAAIRNQSTLYIDALSRARERIMNYFDTSAPAVKSALDTIDELAGAELPGDMPDISGSLALLLRIGGEAASP